MKRIALIPTALAALALAACETTGVDTPAGVYLTGNPTVSDDFNDYEQDFNVAVRNPDRDVVIVYNSGQWRARSGGRCNPRGILPVFKTLAGAQVGRSRFVVFYMCPGRSGGDSAGGLVNQPMYFHSVDIERVVDGLIAGGTPPRHIVVAGHSWGASSALLMASRGSDKIAGVIAVAPGHGYAYLGATAGSRGDTQTIQGQWREAIRAIDKPALIYAIEQDFYSPPEDIAFVADMPNVDYRVVSGNRPDGGCGDVDASGVPWTQCFAGEHPHIVNFAKQFAN